MAEFMEIKAAADFLGNGAIEINRYESEIYDICRRGSITLQRLPGAPHRYFEQTAVAQAQFTDPRNITPSASGPNRVERSAVIKAIVGQTNLSLFDVDVTRQQGQFAYVEAKDIEDIVSGIELARASSVWSGNDTSLTIPTTNQYMGLLSQLSQQFTVAPGASIIDGIKAAVAQMVANQTYKVMPSCIYVNPLLGDYIDREAKATEVTLGQMNVGTGLVVSTINTQAGALPIVPDPFLPFASTAQYGFSAPPSGYRSYFVAILSEDAVEIPYVHGGDGNPNPRIFQLGLLGGLQGQYVGIKFDCVIAKGASYAHAVVAVQRP
jgi:hypothetical protein